MPSSPPTALARVPYLRHFFNALKPIPLRWAGIFYLASIKNKRPMEHSPWAFTFPQPPPLLFTALKLTFFY